MPAPARFDPQPIVLTGTHVRLEPLDLSHADDLLHAARDPEVFRLLNLSPPKTRADIERFIHAAVENELAGKEIPFAIVQLATGKAVGTTRYMSIERPNRNLEIGWTWHSSDVWRTAVNTEAKLLLFTHAFETLGALRVMLKVDSRNRRSQAAVARLGAVREGVFRKHMINFDGYLRDSVFFSVLETEWPAVKAGLIAKLAR